MNRKTCTNLMKDCYPYLNATNLQGRNMLDMKRMKKFQKNKDEIQKRLADLRKKLASTENQDEIIEALENYQTRLQDAMRLKKEDFTGEGADDFKYGFKMPLRCVNDTNCEWICQKMIRHDGITDDAVESEHNTKIEELETDDEQQFETDLVIVDDHEDEDEDDHDDDHHDDDDSDSTNKTDSGRRLLAAESISIVYDDAGYSADDDSFEAGVEVSEPAMAEGIVVPEDSVDPENPNGSSSGTKWGLWALGGVATLALVAFIFCMLKNNKNEETHFENPSEIHMTERSTN